MLDFIGQEPSGAGVHMASTPPGAGAAYDSDAWGELADLFGAHPALTDAQCRAVVQDASAARRAAPWQAKLLRIWPRWKQHHHDLRTGLAQAGPLTWAQRCRFCAIWSASRPVMAPFCGVAAILLEAPPAVDSPLDAASDAAPAPAGVLVMSADPDLATFMAEGASRQLVWALENSGLAWSLCQPWAVDRASLDPERVQGVVFWSFRHLQHHFIHHALAVEEACVARGIPVLNSIARGWDVRHSTILDRFQQAGLRCARWQKFASVGGITLPYPLILRVDGIHRGRQMHLVHDADAAQSLVDATRAAFLAAGGYQVLPPPNLALEYIDVADAHGLYHKYRAYVVGSDVRLRHKTTGSNWRMHYASSDAIASAPEGPRDRLPGGVDPALLALAGLASGSDVTAVDYAVTAAGEPVFWEANRLFSMNGDKDYELGDAPSAKSPRSVNRRAVQDRRLGEALRALVQARFATVSRGPGDTNEGC